MTQDYTIEELKSFFDTATLPEGPVWLNKYMLIHNLRVFVDAQFTLIENTQHMKQPTPAFLRLVEVKEWLEKRDN